MAKDNIDALIEETGGCGRFQILLVIACCIAELTFAWSIMMMSFGVYNPGMECVTSDLNIPATGMANSTTPAFPSVSFNLTYTGSENLYLSPESKNWTTQFLERNSTFVENVCDCPGEIQFKRSASTIVTEWSLVCDRAWISSVIISLQMAGVLIGTPIGGQIALRFGRKVTVYGSLALNAILNFVAYFSVSWTMFAILRFLIGMSFGGIDSSSFVYCTEFLTHRWRGYLAAIPDWNISSVLLALVLVALRDWRNIHLTIGTVALLSCLPAFWAPESMRWLSVRAKVSKASKIAKKIAATNKKPEPNIDILLKERDYLYDNTQPHRIIDLLRRDLRKRSILMGFVWFTLSAVFYGVSFGVKALSGNFYINFLALNFFSIPTRFAGAIVVNRIGRRLTAIFYFSIAAVACVSITGVHFLVRSEELAGTVITVLAITCNSCVITVWGVCSAWVVELYPTTIRSVAFSWMGVMARIGGIVSPYILPKGIVPLYGSFLVMGFLIICSILSLLCLPETKGKPLQDITILEPNISVLRDTCEERTENEDKASNNTILDDMDKHKMIRQV